MRTHFTHERSFLTNERIFVPLGKWSYDGRCKYALIVNLAELAVVVTLVPLRNSSRSQVACGIPQDYRWRQGRF